MRKLQYQPFSANAIKPEGWLRKQLTLQANGLAGNLDKIWPDVKDSMWIGGNHYDWERVPYWLDGFIPLAFLLDDTNPHTVLNVRPYFIKVAGKTVGL